MILIYQLPKCLFCFIGEIIFLNKIKPQMNPQTHRVVTNTLSFLEEKLWQGVAAQNIRKIAPTAAKLESIQFLSSYISNANNNREKHGIYEPEKDPVPIPLDALAVGSTHMQPDNRSDRKSSIDNISSKARTRKFTNQSFFSKKFTEPRRTQYDGEPKIVELPHVPDEHIVIDPDQQELRENLFKNEKYDLEMKKMGQEIKTKRQQQEGKSKKMFKDVKKFTFDYAGKFIGIGNFDPGTNKPIKLNKNDGEMKITKKQIKKSEEFSIQNEKLKERGKKNKGDDKNLPAFDSNRPDTLVDLLKGQTDVSEGVKMIAHKGNEKIVKEKQRKPLSGIKKCRLNEIKGMPQEQKFREYRSRALKPSSSATLDVNKTAPLPISSKEEPEDKKQIQQVTEKNLQKKSSSQSEQAINVEKSKDPYLLLPPLKSKMLKRMRGAYSNRTIDISHTSSRVSQKSKIVVDHEELFEANFSVPKIN